MFNYDRRGRGDSGDTAPYAALREVEDLEALIQEAGGSAFVFALSSRGVLALEAARGLAITRLALYEPPVVVDDNDRQATQDITAQLTELVSSGRQGDAVELWMKVLGVPAKSIVSLRNEPSWQAFETIAHTLVYDVTLVRDTWAGNPLSTEWWDSVMASTLVMDGGESPWWVGDHAVQALVDALPEAQRRTLEGQNYDVAPDALTSVLIEFFKA